MVLVKVWLRCMFEVYNISYYVTWVSTNNLFVSIIILEVYMFHVSTIINHFPPTHPLFILVGYFVC